MVFNADPYSLEEKKLETILILDVNKCDNDNTPNAHNDQVQMTGNVDDVQQESKIATLIQERRKELLHDFINNTTLHGLRYLFIEKGVRKLIWTFGMVATLFFAVVLFGETLINYPSDSITEFTIQKKTRELNFPTVTICDVNSPVFAEDAYKRFPINITSEQFIDFYRIMLHKYYNKSIQNTPFIRYVIEELRLKNYTSYKDIIELFELNHLQRSTTECFFDGIACNKTSEFKNTLHWGHISLCQQYNFYAYNKPSKATTKYGFYDGLQMQMNIESNSFHPVSFKGMVLSVTPYGMPFQLSQEVDVIFIKPGVYTNIDIELIVEKRLPPPYETSCGTQYFKVLKNHPYSQAMCKIDISLHQAFERCGCVGFEFSDFVGDIPTCGLFEMRCYLDIIRESINDNIDHGCPIECTNDRYHIATSELSLNIPKLQGLMERISATRKRSLSESYKYIKENFVNFRVGYKTLWRRTEAYKPAVTWYALIGTVGGSIGICLGFSVVTLFEIIMFCYNYIQAPCHIKRSIMQKSNTQV